MAIETNSKSQLAGSLTQQHVAESQTLPESAEESLKINQSVYVLINKFDNNLPDNKNFVSIMLNYVILDSCTKSP